MTADQLREFQMKSLDELGEYIYKEGKTKDPQWASNYLRREFKKAFLSIAHMIKSDLPQDSNYYEMLGVDFVIDEDLRVYIIEINASPMIVGTNKRKTQLMQSMLEGLFGITFAQQFSRTERTLNFLERKKAVLQLEDDEGALKGLKKEFDQLYRNDILPKY